MRITNLTADTRIDTVIDFDFLLSQSDNVFQFTRINKNFNAIKMKCVHGSLLIYENGKIVCVGVKSRRNAYMTLRNLCEILKCKRIPRLKFTNFCASTDGAAAVDLYKLLPILVCDTSVKSVQWEPEIFPAATCLLKTLPSKVNVFVSGKLTSTGNKSEVQAFNSLLTITKIIHQVCDVIIDCVHYKLFTVPMVSC